MLNQDYSADRMLAIGMVAVFLISSVIFVGLAWLHNKRNGEKEFNRHQRDITQFRPRIRMK